MRGSDGEPVKNVYRCIVWRDPDLCCIPVLQRLSSHWCLCIQPRAEISSRRDTLVQPPLNLPHLYHDVVRTYVQFVVADPARPFVQPRPLQLTKKWTYFNVPAATKPHVYHLLFMPTSKYNSSHNMQLKRKGRKEISATAIIYSGYSQTLLSSSNNTKGSGFKHLQNSDNKE